MGKRQQEILAEDRQRAGGLQRYGCAAAGRIVAAMSRVPVDGRELADRRRRGSSRTLSGSCGLQHVRMAVEQLREPCGSGARRAKEKYKPCWSERVPHASRLSVQIHQESMFD